MAFPKYCYIFAMLGDIKIMQHAKLCRCNFNQPQYFNY